MVAGGSHKNEKVKVIKSVSHLFLRGTVGSVGGQR